MKLQFFQIKFSADDDDEHTSKKNSRENSFGWIDGVRNETHSLRGETEMLNLRISNQFFSEKLKFKFGYEQACGQPFLFGIRYNNSEKLGSKVIIHQKV